MYLGTVQVGEMSNLCLSIWCYAAFVYLKPVGFTCELKSLEFSDLFVTLADVGCEWTVNNGIALGQDP